MIRVIYSIQNGLCIALTILFLSTNYSEAQWVQQGNKLVGSGGLGNPSQGSSISISADGKTAVVGGPSDNSNVGAVWVYTHNGTNFVQFGNKLIGTGSVGASKQGSSVSISADGKTIAVGAIEDDTLLGAVWVYRFNGSSYVQVANKLVGTGYIGINVPVWQGSAVSLSADGSILIVGAEKDDGGQGACWAYIYNGTRFVQLGSKLVGYGPIGSMGNTSQGHAISVSDDGRTFIVGGWTDNRNNSGGAWIFTYTGGSFQVISTRLTGYDSEDPTQYKTYGTGEGYSVGISGDGQTAVVGGLNDNLSVGAVWVYKFNGTSYTQYGSKLVGLGSTGFSKQGSSVNISNDGKTIIVGARGDNVQRGASWIFTFDGANFLQVGNKIIGSGNTGLAFQGQSVALSANGKTALVGGSTDNGNAGAVWAFKYTGFCETPVITGFRKLGTTCPGTAVSFTVNATWTGILSYKWYQDGNLVATTHLPNYTISGLSATDAGQYVCVVSNDCGSATSAGINVSVGTLNIVTDVLPGIVCLGNPVTITGYGLDSLMILNGPPINTGFIPQNSETFALTGRDPQGCRDTTFVNVTVSSLVVETQGEVYICPGSSVSITASGANNGYEWNDGSNLSSITVFPVDSVNNYTVIGTNTIGCKDTSQFKVFVNFLSLTSPGVNVGTCSCVPVILNIQAVGPQPLQYRWYKNDTLIIGQTRKEYELPPVTLSGVTYKSVVSSPCRVVTTLGMVVKIDCIVADSSQWIQSGCKFLGLGNDGPAGQGISVSVSADGQTAIVGGLQDNENRGAAWVFSFDGLSQMFKQSGPKITSGGAVGIPKFGGAVSISADGRVAIVGGFEDNDKIGAAWIYTFNGAAFVQLGDKLVGTGAVGESQQGRAVSISPDGRMAVVGGYADSNYVGAVWVYTFNGVSFVQYGTKIVSKDTKGQLNYQGYSVDISASGNAIILGGILDDSGTGAAWVYTFNGSSFDQAGHKLKGKDATGKALQGTSVSISGDGKVAIVGGYLDNKEEGAAWIFTFNGANYEQLGSKLVGKGSTGKTQQGVSVDISIDGKIAVMGGYKDSYLGNGLSTGATWVYTFNGMEFIPAGGKLIGTGSKDQSAQGISVSVSEDAKTILVGGYGDNANNGASWAFINPFINCTVPAINGVSDEVRVCDGVSTFITVDATGSGLLKYDWIKNGSVLERTFSNSYKLAGLAANLEGRYICRVINSCGTVTSAEINVTSKRLEEVSLDLSPIDKICDTLSPITLTGGLPVGGEYWYNNKLVNQLNTSIAGSYFIVYRYKDQIQCVYTATGILTSIHCTVPGICERPDPPCHCTNTCPPRFNIYTAFSPNADGVNDIWYIDSLSTDNSVTILDKWGNEIYKATHYNNDWDGKRDGRDLPFGIYYYIVEVEKKRFAGTVSIIR